MATARTHGSSTPRPAPRRRSLAALLLGLALAAPACDLSFDTTFVIDDLAVLGVRLEPAEVLLDLEQMRRIPDGETLHVEPLTASVLAVNPESAGGRDAILRYHWSIGDPPLEGTQTVVTEQPSLQIGASSMTAVLSSYYGEEGIPTWDEIADTLEQGPVQLPLFVTALTADRSATGVKMVTVRGRDAIEDAPNANPGAEELEVGGRAFSEELLDLLGEAPAHAEAAARSSQVAIRVNPGDPDADDGDVATTMYCTAGTIHWSQDTMRTWVLQTPGEEYPYDELLVAITLRDQEGGQSWVTVIQPLR